MSKYYSLPFTVHFDEIGYEEFESVELAAYHPDEGSIVCMRQRGSSKGAAFICREPSKKRLIAALALRLDGYLPSWLEIVEDDDLEINEQDLCIVRVSRDGRVLVEDLDSEALEEDATEVVNNFSTIAFYDATYDTPSRITLDALGDEIEVYPDDISFDPTEANPSQPILPTEEDCHSCDEGALARSDALQALRELFAVAKKPAAKKPAAKKPAAKKPAAKKPAKK